MNQTLIKDNEAQNKGEYIYLYLCDNNGQWAAYGESAFALRLWVKKEGYDSLRVYSNELQMPCTIVSHKTINNLLQQLNISNENKERIKLSIPKDLKFEYADYLMWVDKLQKDDDCGRHQMKVRTLVSDRVPKNKFIPDGMSSFSRNCKRFFDFIAATIMLLFSSPLMLICCIAIKLDDGGPIIYAQERIGRFGRTFKIYKFRSMKVDAEKMGPQLSSQQGQGDARLTRVGRFLRIRHLDELPQLWNVFLGDMTFIGPRPERQFFINQILEYDKRYTYLYQIRPGLTSYATLYNGYTDTIEKMLKRLEYDLYYLQNRSWILDLKILGVTFWKFITGKEI